MRIGILKCGQSPELLRGELGDYDTMFERLLAGRGFQFDSYHVEGMQFPQDVHDADGWLLTGSRHGTYEDHPFIPPLEEFIRQAYAERVPMVGICFGHQIIAQALGGKVIKHPKGWAVGPQDYDFGGDRVTLNAWHQDQVVTLPEGAEPAASNDFCENAALIYGDRAYTIQAHPEFDAAFIDGLIAHRAKGVVPPEVLEAAGRRKGAPLQSAGIADRIEAFFKAARSEAAPARRGRA
ncbi:GMP synthase-Glutamine amidotransferase [Paracoccus halophilus]|uniref:Glutamine amidotransferase n=1 Tax=Paracoccus halophilus TaxID=376733 RepID=A0A099F126_9RHOB|nr:type 1 glutamine amidotransferase [Paracoccus halophilus]KGJ04149.1 glutamine amidotransferase [Paracoccus halophilus]SFA55740.1 GMP synthase-Glutamine amidotransferase [Paracoccus halophilus]